MLFEQSKLTRNEWNFTEIPIDDDEKYILKMMIEGFHDVNLKKNKHQSLYSYIKIEDNEAMTHHLYKTYFEKFVAKVLKKHDLTFTYESKKIKTIRSGEKIKIEHVSKDIENAGPKIFEFYLLYVIEKLCKYYDKDDDEKFHIYYYVLSKALTLHINRINEIFLRFSKYILNHYKEDIEIVTMFRYANKIIGENKYIADVNDYTLYDHQKQVYTYCKNPNPKLILYIAPTGTGKTLTPIGLTESYKVIFVCAARHVGLALARSAISMSKKVAFAFGCNSVDDIRLHYFSASKYVRRDDGTEIKYKDGSRKVDHTEGSKVELMICDLKSYITAMYYMNSFNDTEKLIMYWDEPTIGLDYEEENGEENGEENEKKNEEENEKKKEEQRLIHHYIHKNWSDNIVPNIILSSATLPKQEEIVDTITDYRVRFGNNIHNIISDDCSKSISLINVDNCIVMPHLQYENYELMKQSVEHCLNYNNYR